MLQSINKLEQLFYIISNYFILFQIKATYPRTNNRITSPFLGWIRLSMAGLKRGPRNIFPCIAKNNTHAHCRKELQPIISGEIHGSPQKIFHLISILTNFTHNYNTRSKYIDIDIVKTKSLFIPFARTTHGLKLTKVLKLWMEHFATSIKSRNINDFY